MGLIIGKNTKVNTSNLNNSIEQFNMNFEILKFDCYKIQNFDVIMFFESKENQILNVIRTPIELKI